MKPQSIEYLLDCYVRERNCHYDVVDGVRRHGPNYDSLAGETTLDLDDRCNELQFMHPQSAVPVVEEVMVQPNHVPLSTEMEERTKQFARQLISFSDQFEFIHSGCSKTRSAGSSGIEFKDLNIFVSADSKVIKISVVRKDAEQSTKAKWKTCDKTAKSGIHFDASEGDVLFNEGELESIIEIALLENNDSGIDKRFQVELFDPEGNDVGKRNCVTVNICDEARKYAHFCYILLFCNFLFCTYIFRNSVSISCITCF
ncbi:uncharacterized protein LOC118190420 isoform X2 [Stegodyphus dumicola]|uniref:uncharacterized protein LOC118190420 isoform X2 n=1 Tax=Stegodyphus dumicola TaxID=202533 RepID=UPI0015A9C627|nr:uncharacterized protein LOC118190420 isoform X2 [Stegodyphus dumicola]